jgi:hypothetical protein
MSEKSPSLNPLRIAMARLHELKVEFEHDGIMAEKARSSLLEDSRRVGRQLYLRTHAFKPTGVALGFPLPEPSLQSLFSAVCDDVEEYLRRLCGVVGPVLSRVPADAYHITLVNRTHFDKQKNKSKVHPMNLAEKEQAELIIRRQCCRPVVVRYRGLLATRSGRVMVPAYAEDCEVFRLKEALRDGVLGGRRRQPVLAENYPVITLTKLGHIVVALNGVRLREFLGWMRDEGAKIDARVTFPDAYTPFGRVPL